MSQAPELSEAKRALLEKLLGGDTTSAQALCAPTERSAPAEVLETRAPVFPVKPSGSRKPFFFLHGDWLFGSFFCHPLAHSLGSEQPFYVLHPYKLSDLAALPTIETIAAEHLTSVRSIQPSGPYLLGGFCNGALLAHEMALQLDSAGEKVDLLVMMEPMEPVSQPKLKRRYRFLRRLGEILGVDARGRLDWFLRYAHLRQYALTLYESRRAEYRRAAARMRSDERIELRHLHSPGVFGIWPSGRELRKNFECTFNWIACEYAPAGVFPGKIAVFWTSAEPLTSLRRVLWSDLLRTKRGEDVEVRILAGSHHTCKTVHLADTARNLSECLEWALAR